MQADGLTICMALLAAIAMLLVETTNRKWMRTMEKKEELWAAERTDLLSRIMAPDLQAYTTSTVRIKNAEKPKDEEVKPIDWAG